MELLASTGGNSDPSSDKTLPSAPYYQSGPFGDFYLSPYITPLVFNCGSRSPASAGLWQGTSRLDQIKDANQTAVNIGLHYVATANPSNTVAKDSDADGIPDYIEDANGNGVRDSGVETDWVNAYSDTDPNTGPIADSVNAMYDKVDLDGDGLTGAAERFLGTDPLVPSNPLQLPAIQNASGFLDVPLTLSLRAGAWSALRLYVNGKENPFGEIVHMPDNTWHAQFDTFGAASGPCLLQLAVSFAPGIEMGERVRTFFSGRDCQCCGRRTAH